METPEPSRFAIRRRGILLSAAGGVREVVWRKASASDSQGCVEVTTMGSHVYIQDSKSPDGGLVLTLSPRSWGELLAAVRAL
ncbi:DUF397 domain-containing protein [Actinomadura rudentiformis]|uniref:DUF397 domain-containing protein n=1 Tax=Actinomadura rudentiformis TaxID=359158 RepID=UPI001CEF8414|nr:DUF397 domain-containing protein [Actinomadura rudentiformis]